MSRTVLPALAGALFLGFSLTSPGAIAAMPVSAAMASSHDNPVIMIAKKKRMTRREEADQSARDGTVPARYRRDIPKQYHQYIPFAKQ